MPSLIRVLHLALYLLLAGCNEINVSLKDSFITTPGPRVTINKAKSETVGSCIFSLAPDYTQVANFEYRVTFSEVIDPLTLDVSDFANNGTGSGVVWNLTNCGDDTNFKLAVSSVGVDGTIVPVLSQDSALSLTNYGNKTSTGTDNVVTYDTLSPSVTLNVATNQTVGSCVFNSVNGHAGTSGFSYRVTFAEVIDSSTFTSADITNGGTGGATLNWAIASCGDGRNFRLSASSVSGDGTIVPSIGPGLIEDLAGNLNTASASTDNTINFDSVAPTVTIEQAITETVGSCSFAAASDPTNTSNLRYRVQVSEPINTSSLTPSDFVNAGSGGNITLQWALTNCGDNMNFMLSSISVLGDGTIIPNLPADSFTDLAGNGNLVSTSVDNSITFSISGPGVTINQAVAETVGSCTFNATTDPTDVVGFEYRITFSKVIDGGTFDLSDIVNSGTGGTTTLTWNLTNCGDDTNFMLKTTAIDGYGSIIPTIAAGRVQDLISNSNSASTATDNVVQFAEIGWSQEAYIKPSDNEAFDLFGTNISLNGDLLAVSVDTDDNSLNTITNGPTFTPNNDLQNSGAVYVFKRTGLNWVQEAFIKAPDAEEWGKFGQVLSMNGDTLAVGVPVEASNQNVITNGEGGSLDSSAWDSGAVYVFRRVDDLWVQEAFIKASNSDSDDNFGYGLSLEGNTLVVGAYGESSNQTTITTGASASADNSMEGSGAVYVFHRSGSSWEEEAFIKASNNGEYDNFGYSVSLSGDTIAVSSPYEDSIETIITNGSSAPSNDMRDDSGAVYVYRRVAGIWQPEAHIKASNADEYITYGDVVRLDGDTLAVSSVYENSSQNFITNGTGSSLDTSGTNTGAIYIYKRTGTNWAQEAYIKSSNIEDNDYFGSAFDLKGDFLIVGVPEEDSNQNTITKGAGASSDNSTENSGAVFVFKRTGVNWAQTAYIKTPINDIWYGTGYSVSLSGDTLAISAPGDSNSINTVINGAGPVPYDNASESSGAVYIYRFNGELMELDGLRSSVGLNSVTVDWAKLLVATGYVISYQTGTVPPASCSLGTVVSPGDVNHYVINGLTTGTTYSFRLCATNGSTTTQGVTFTATPSDNVRPSVTVNQAVSETIGSCVFTPVTEPVDTAGFSYKVTFSSAINPASFTESDISNAGTGGAAITWQIENCGDDMNFKLTALTVGGPGTIMPYIGAGKVARPNGVLNLASTSTDNSISYIEYGWYQEAFIKASNTASIYGFGEAISLSGDTLVVGVLQESSGENTITTTPPSPSMDSYNSGAVYVYHRNGSMWEMQAFIKAVNRHDSMWFGESVSIHGDLIAVGASREDSAETTITNGNTASSDQSAYSPGAVFVYKRTGTTWEQEAYIKAVNADNFDNFGTNVSLHGNLLVVGAVGESSNETIITNGPTASANNSLSGAGAIYIYERDTTWSMSAYIKASNAGANDNFGARVVLNEDTLAVGVPNEDSNETSITNGTSSSLDNSLSESGAVYIYRKTGTTWEQEAYIKASNSDGDDGFGSALSLQGDYLAVAAPWESSSDSSITNGPTASLDNSNSSSGAVYVYKRTGVNWAQEAYIKPVNNQPFQNFGSSVALNGRFLAVGSPGESSNQRTITKGNTASSDTSFKNSGAVYVYERVGVNWDQSAYIKASNNDGLFLPVSGGDFPGDYFGAAVSFKGDTLTVGVSDESSCQNFITNGSSASSDNSCMSTGAVFVYRNNDTLFDVSDIFATPLDTSVTLKWFKSGGIATGHRLIWTAGTVAPGDCTQLGHLTLGNVDTYTISGLVPETTYSLRICTTDGTDVTEGTTITFTTTE